MPDGGDREGGIRGLVWAHGEKDEHPDHHGEDPAFNSARQSTAPAGSARTYTYGGSVFATEREMVVRFLDDFRAAESFGAEVLALWAEVTREPLLRGGLRTLCCRERSHGELLARRLGELGGSCDADLSQNLKQAARARLASTDVSDVEKLKDLVTRYPDIDAAVGPIRDVVAQIGDDAETKGLLTTILDDEIATLRWISTTYKTLMAASARAR